MITSYSQEDIIQSSKEIIIIIIIIIIGVNVKLEVIQKTALLGTAKILRKVLSL